MTIKALAIASLLALAGCPDGTEPTTLPRSTDEPRAACHLASQRCQRCHTLDRIFQSRLRGEAAWTSYVHEMRLMPSSGIPPEEEPVLVSCLAYEGASITGVQMIAREVGR